MTDRFTFDHDASVAGVRAYFDALGEGEWERLEVDLPARVSLEVHLRFLARFITPGMRVLEIGAGPGRFTIACAALGARVVVTDVSPVQVELNERHVVAAGCEGAVERREVVDICDLSRYASGEFDAVVAYGGPLSYAFDRVPDALAGLLRVVRRGGPVVASVMSLPGAYRHFLNSVVDIDETLGRAVTEQVLRTGDIRAELLPGPGRHSCRLLRAREVSELVSDAGASILAMSASNWASLGELAAVERLAADPARWAWFLDAEVTMCAEPGAVDGGTHLLFAAAQDGHPSRTKVGDAGIEPATSSV